MVCRDSVCVCVYVYMFTVYIQYTYKVQLLQLESTEADSYYPQLCCLLELHIPKKVIRFTSQESVGSSDHSEHFFVRNLCGVKSANANKHANVK